MGAERVPPSWPAVQFLESRDLGLFNIMIGSAKHLAIPAASVIACVSLGFVLGEIFLRSVDYSFPSFYMYDLHVGARHRPDARGWFRKEAEVLVAINSQGIRVPVDRPNSVIPFEKPTDVLRFSVFGDSFTEGLQVAARERFTHVMEEELNQCDARPRPRIEVINFGVSGMGQAREMAMYESFGRRFNPDVVLVVIAENDFGNNLRELTPDPFSPHWTLDENGAFAWDLRFQSDPAFLRKLRWSSLRQEITSYSRVLQLLTEVYVKQVLEAGATQPWKDTSQNREHAAPPLVVAPPSSAILKRAWKLFAAGMRVWSESVRAEGRAFMVTSVPMHHVMRKEAWESYAASFGARGGDLVPDHVDNMISDLARDAGFLYFSVIGPMREQGFANNVDFYYHAYSKINWGHLNAVGHRYFGKELARKICRYWQIRRESGRTQ